MSDQLMKGARQLGTATALLVLPISASAQMACVHCTGPDATYSCSAISENRVPEAAVGLFCVSRVASTHNHASCSAERGRSTCDGLPVSYVYDESAVPTAPGVVKSRSERVETDTPENDEPQTLGEFTKETVSTSAKAMKKVGENIGTTAANAGTAAANAIKDTGKTVGDATKKTLKCLGSALNDC